MECLQHRNINIQNSINEQLSLHQDASPLEQIHIIFNWYIEWINSETFNGCLFKRHLLKYLNNILQFANHFMNIQNG